MRKRALLAILVVIAAAAVAVPAYALQFAAPDGNAHPYVGMSAYYDAAGNPLWLCSGTLISPTTYVTAGHCAGKDTEGHVPAFAVLYFAENPSSAAPSAVGIPVADPQWTGALEKGDTHDIGVVHIVQQLGPLPTQYATLPSRGYVDGLTTKRGQKDTGFSVVGYGVYDITPKVESWIPQRWLGATQLQTADAYNLRMTDAPGAGTGGSGTCYGDSGGAVLQGSTLVGVISFGTKYCMGTSGAYRLDTPGARAFLASQGVALP